MNANQTEALTRLLNLPLLRMETPLWSRRKTGDGFQTMKRFLAALKEFILSLGDLGDILRLMEMPPHAHPLFHRFAEQDDERPTDGASEVEMLLACFDESRPVLEALQGVFAAYAAAREEKKQAMYRDAADQLGVSVEELRGMVRGGVRAAFAAWGQVPSDDVFREAARQLGLAEDTLEELVIDHIRREVIARAGLPEESTWADIADVRTAALEAFKESPVIQSIIWIQMMVAQGPPPEGDDPADED